MDLDETLVHAVRASTDDAIASSIRRGGADVVDVDIGNERLLVCKRPGLDDFLRRASTRFELVLFTASIERYATPIIDAIDPDGTSFRRRLFRQHCVFDVFHSKDLLILDRPLSRVVLVDNSPCSFRPQLRNGIPIASFTGDPNDTALATLLRFLVAVDAQADVRPLLDDVFALEALLGSGERWPRAESDCRGSQAPDSVQAPTSERRSGPSYPGSGTHASPDVVGSQGVPTPTGQP